MKFSDTGVVTARTAVVRSATEFQIMTDMGIQPVSPSIQGKGSNIQMLRFEMVCPSCLLRQSLWLRGLDPPGNLPRTYFQDVRIERMAYDGLGGVARSPRGLRCPGGDHDLTLSTSNWVNTRDVAPCLVSQSNVFPQPF